MFERLTENIHKLLDEKYKKLISNNKNYQSKKREISENNISMICIDISALVREKEKGESEIDKNYSTLISQSQEQFKYFTLVVIPRLQNIIDKFKLDVYNTMNSLCVEM
jgi:hypothetical protein